MSDLPGSMPTWQPTADTASWQRDELITWDGRCIAALDQFWHAAYPAALNARTGNWERGGCYRDRVEAILWAERVAGLHPLKPGDERPPFYYRPGDGAE